MTLEEDDDRAGRQGVVVEALLFFRFFVDLFDTGVVKQQGTLIYLLCYFLVCIHVACFTYLSICGLPISLEKPCL